MRVHRRSWMILWLAGLAAFAAGHEARCQIPRGYFTSPIELGPIVNSAGADTSPAISADGLTLYFNSNRREGEGHFDLYQATRPTVNDEFGEVTNLGPDVNSPALDGYPRISSDGLTLYFMSNRSGGEGSFDIYQATRLTVNDVFDEVINLRAINSPSEDWPGHVSPDNLTLYFNSDRGEDGHDLYMATRENLSDPFANVTNLGSEINGPTHEISASVSSDGLVMFFSDHVEGPPYRTGGEGNTDFWVAVRETTDAPFGEVVNLNDFSLGSDVNSQLREHSPTISRDWPASGSQLYFTVVAKPGRGDIWQATWVLDDEPIGPLAAGDADQDLDFDQIDLVHVLQANKYLTGEAATWGEGDWDGAPGGSPGNPPVGNGTFDQLDIIAALARGHYLTGPYVAIQPVGQRGDRKTSVGYHAATGEVWVDTPVGTDLTSIHIDSAEGIFIGNPAENLGGSFDNDANNNIFKATFGSSFASLSFGNVARAGLSEEFVLSDLTIIGSLAGGGDLSNVDLVYVPEPSTIGMLVFGMLLGLRRFRRTIA